jgi:hypothetical protein
MSTAYKYCDSRGIDILKYLELKITPPNQFNDPFEFSPHVICSNVDRIARNLIETQEDENILNMRCQKETASGRFSGTFFTFKEKFITSCLMQAIPGALEQFQESYPDVISARFGVLCLSKKQDSIVMFSHYGDNHQGLVIGFDSSHAVFQKGKGLQPVTYVKERLVYDMNWEVGGEQERKYGEAIVFSKNEEWIYEGEVRQIFQLDNGPIKKPIEDKRTGEKKTCYFVPIPPETVVSVSLGAKCALELKNQVQLVLRNKHFSHVKLDRARLHKSKFELTFEKLV